MQKPKRHVAAIVVIIIEVIALIMTTNWQFRGNALNKIKVQKTRTATVFIPGFAGNVISTDDFITQFSQHKLAKRTLRIGISKNGKVRTIKQYAPVKKNNPLVQLSYQDNTHPYKESKQLVNVMRYLKSKYHINRVNMIGHSSGGNIAYEYMVNNPHLKGVPSVHKFVTIGANYPHNDPRVVNLPKSLMILNIAGQIQLGTFKFSSDGEVPIKIVKPMDKLVDGHVKSYHFMIYSGNPLSAEHSMLHENPDLDRYIARFLFNENNTNGL